MNPLPIQSPIDSVSPIISYRSILPLSPGTKPSLCPRSRDGLSPLWSLLNNSRSLRATAANTPTATTPEYVFHSRGRNVEGKESWEWKTPGTSEEDIVSQDSNKPIDHGHLARTCSIKIITPAVKASFISRRKWLEDAEEDIKDMGIKCWRRRTQDRQDWASVVRQTLVLEGP